MFFIQTCVEWGRRLVHDWNWGDTIIYQLCYMCRILVSNPYSHFFDLYLYCISRCIPLQLEMEVPTQPIGDSYPGDEAYDNVIQYLHLAMDVGNSGRRNEERVMLEQLIKVDPLQPSAYNNLFVSCSLLAVMAERFHPEEYKELEFKAIMYLTHLSDLLISDEMCGQVKALDGPHKEMAEAFLRLIYVTALPFIEGCMRGQRGAEHPLLKRIEMCLIGILLFLDRQDEPMYQVQLMLGYCLQKLAKVSLLFLYSRYCQLAICISLIKMFEL